jgi:Fic family protein
MALARADGTSHGFYSMSRQIAQERKAYYTQFERQQKGGVDITSWLSWFLHCFSRAVVTAENTQMLIRHRIEGYAGTRRPPRSDSNPGGGRSTGYRLITAQELEQSGDGLTNMVLAI